MQVMQDHNEQQHISKYKYIRVRCVISYTASHVIHVISVSSLVYSCRVAISLKKVCETQCHITIYFEKALSGAGISNY